MMRRCPTCNKPVRVGAYDETCRCPRCYDQFHPENSLPYIVAVDGDDE